MGGASGAAAAIANAIKASGVICRVEPQDFVAIVRKIDKPLVVLTGPSMFSRNFKYLTSYKGLAFFTKSAEQIQFAPGVELVNCSRMWMPG